MFARIAFAVPFGAAVTAGLLLLMHVLIDNGQASVDAPTARIVDFVRIEREQVVESREERPDRPEEAAPMPDMPQPDFNPDFDGTIEFAMARPDVAFNANITGTGFNVTDGEYLPIVKVAAEYPMRALQRRMEGYVIVKFVVTSTGNVRDVEVVESTAEIFEEAAIEAAQKFRYKPRIIDGQPIEVTGVHNKITFRLDA